MAIDKVRVNEQSTKHIEFDIVDQDDVVVSVEILTAATLTLYDMDTFVPGSPTMGTINGRDGQNVLGDNNVQINASGHVIWMVQPDDNIIVNPRRQIERHRAEFLFVWPTGEFRFPIEIEVVNLGKAR